MKYLLILLLCANDLSAGTHNLSNIDKALKLASLTNKVPFRLLRAICKVESNLDPEVTNQFDHGSASYGLCQIKLATAKGVGYRGNIYNLYNPYINANISARYLRFQLKRYDNDWVRAISAYNAGSYKIKPTNTKYIRRVLAKVEL